MNQEFTITDLSKLASSCSQTIDEFMEAQADSWKYIQVYDDPKTIEWEWRAYVLLNDTYQAYKRAKHGFRVPVTTES